MQVASFFDFDFDGERRDVALAQALRRLDPQQIAIQAERCRAYAAAGFAGFVSPADDTDALRRHHARPAAIPPTRLGEAA